MDRESVNRHRFDRLLEQRLDWVDSADQEAYIESLPDVSEKMTRGLDDPEEAEGVEEGAATDSFASVNPPASSEISESTPASGGFNPPGGFSSGGTELS